MLLALVLAVVLAGKDAEAQTIADIPNSGVSWNVGAGSTPPTVSLNGSQLAVVQSLAVTAVLLGVTQVWPVGRALSVGASVMGAAGRQILQSQMAKSALTGAALAAALALTGDTTYDPTSNSFQTVPAAPGSGVWQWQGGVAGSLLFDSPQDACADVVPRWAALNHLSGITLKSVVYSAPNYVCYMNGTGSFTSVYQTTTCVSGYTKSGSTCVFSGQKVPATNAQIESAIAAAPASWTNVWSAGGCDSKANSYVDLVYAGTINDPCAVIVGGSVPSTATAPTSNNPYGWPSEQWTKAYNGLTETHTVQTSSQVSGNTGVDAKSNPVSVTTTKTETVTTKDSAGNTTTTTTTTTGPAQTKSDTPATTATFNGQTGSLYTKRTRTWVGVLTDFSNTVKGAPWYSAAVGFFTVTIAGGACPHWTAAATKWTPPLDASPYVCSSTMTALYAVGGAVVLAVAAWAAFRIAFL